jgi:glycosyltransferase involved in cell wall biosynthesis
MKVLYFHQYFQTRNSAGGTRSYEFSKRFVDSGNKVTIVCARNSSEDLSLNDYVGRGYRRGIVDGIDVIQIDLFSSNKSDFFHRTIVFIRFAFRSVLFAFSEEYDILLATSTPLTIGVPGIILKFFKPRKKFVFEVRDLWPELPKAMGVIKNPILLWLMKRLEVMTYKSADACIGLSPGIIEGIARYGVPRNKIALIPNACDLDLFSAGKQDKSIIPGCDSNSFIAIFTGAHGLANGLDYVLDAAKCLKEANADRIRIVLIGDGSQKQRLIDRANQSGLDNCIFLDPVPKLRLAKILKAADAGMMILADVPAFSYGTSPNKFFDYIACGLPVIVNHYGWVADLLKQNYCGFAVDPKRPQDFAGRLIELSLNAKLCLEFGLNSRALAEREFSRDDLTNKWIDFIEKV